MNASGGDGGPSALFARCKFCSSLITENGFLVIPLSDRFRTMEYLWTQGGLWGLKRPQRMQPSAEAAPVNSRRWPDAWLCLLLCLFVSLCQAASAAPDYPPRPWAVSEQRAPCTHYKAERQVFFGDTHVHTAYSLDAGFWDTRSRPEDAYRFAKGERLGVPPYDEEGKPLRYMQLSRPLDFTMVSDHAEHLGSVEICRQPGLEGYDSRRCRMLRERPFRAFISWLALPLIRSELAMRYRFLAFLAPSEGTDRYPSFCGPDGEGCRAAGGAVWVRIQEAAENAYDRSETCAFTSFIGYEWTGYNGANLHRNVLFQNDKVPALATSYHDAPSAEELWEALRSDCLAAGIGCDVLAIPHNSNLSIGQIFATPENRSITATAARFRSRMEPLLEIMQHKGDSECWYGPGGSPDELCAFEKLPYNSFGGRIFPSMARLSGPGDGYARRILGDGLRYEKAIGANPYRLGFIASTDNHLGTPGAVEEKAFQGHTAAAQLLRGERQVLPDALEYGPGGLAAVWAEENTRDALFAAMKRRETFGTSGPRMKVRFFGGWQYPQDLCQSPDFVRQGYAEGVPMGGMLPSSETGGAPRFAVRALRDPGTLVHPGMPLQRLQIIKGWVDEAGAAKERVYEVAGEPDNGARVDTATCEAKGAGFDQLCAMWSDPEFKAGQGAYYYARAVENPSCRWSQHVCNAHGVDCARPETVGKGLEECCAAEHRSTIQERAWSSPIWYRPPG